MFALRILGREAAALGHVLRFDLVSLVLVMIVAGAVAVPAGAGAGAARRACRRCFHQAGTMASTPSAQPAPKATSTTMTSADVNTAVRLPGAHPGKTSALACGARRAEPTTRAPGTRSRTDLSSAWRRGATAE